MTTASTSTPPLSNPSNRHGHVRQSSRLDSEQQQMSRQSSKRQSPLINFPPYKSQVSSMANKFDVADSSDDEVPAPMKLSAEARALLGEDPSLDDGDGSSNSRKSSSSHHSSPRIIRDGGSRRPSPDYKAPLRTQHESSSRHYGSPVPRVVRLSGGTSGSLTLKRGTASSTSSGELRIRRSREVTPENFVTPAIRARDFAYSSTVPRAESPVARDARGSTSDDQSAPANGAHERSRSFDASHVDEGSVLRGNMSTIGRFRSGEEPPLQGSIRIKRIGRMNGTLLRGPARRGMFRRSSEEQRFDVQQPPDEKEGRRSTKTNENENSAPETGRGTSQQSQNSDPLPHVRWSSNASQDLQTQEGNAPQLINNLESTPPSQHPAYVPSSFVATSSKQNQENEIPPTLKRNRQGSLADSHDDMKSSGKKVEIQRAKVTPAPSPGQRSALSSRSQNTPHRPAPPPPKTSVLDTASASASQSKKRKGYMSVNGKIFSRLDLLGRGGSSKVYRVMAENFQEFALKRVDLTDVDEATVRGYKGEIELLKKLERVDRVIRLFDWELKKSHDRETGEEKETLSILMERGEIELEKILRLRLDVENARFDPSFTRHYWKEMLECVRAIQQYDVVHSDLKPANFVLVKGQLKLIDFGIANAIQDDTVNVHREQQVGTPNYMSPEALIDINAVQGHGSSSDRLIKIGKPSDVWSLGCILYRMVYGRPPFDHIRKQYEKIIAIPNPKYVIEFPSKGVGDAPVPAGLIYVMKKCLNRDPSQRLTIEEMLSDKDPFLHPDQQVDTSLPIGEKMLGRVLQTMINQCHKEIPSDKDIWAIWTPGLYARVRQMLQEEGTLS